MSMRRRTIRSAAGACDAQAAIAETQQRRAAADPGRRHRALFQGADAGARGGAADPGRHPRAVRARLAAEGVAPLHADLRSAIRRRRRGSCRATACASAARWRCCRRPAARSPTGTATACRRRSIRTHAVKCFLDPDRAELLSPDRRALRRDAAAGALEEVRALAARALDPVLPAMKAHGVPWLIRHLDGEIDARRGGRGRQARHPPLYQAAGHLVSQPDAGLVPGSRRTRPGVRRDAISGVRLAVAVRPNIS